MQRRLLDHAVISLKGMAMGAADAVPGVSGGTIALIAGIYEELITTISNVDLKLFTTWKENGFKAFWKDINGNFILALLLGIAISIVTFTRLAKYLIEHHPILIWSFFFGLVVASVYFVGKQIEKWSVGAIVGLILGTAIAYYISNIPPLSQNDSAWFLMLAGSLAICAMILPGISGAFILLILGAYKTTIDALHDLDFKKIGLFILGALIGLLTFSRILKWLFKNYHNLTLAVLTGFILGSLNKIWPWKKVLTWRKDSDGADIPLLEESVWPGNYAGDPKILYAILLMIAGFLTIVILERLGSKTE